MDLYFGATHLYYKNDALSYNVRITNINIVKILEVYGESLQILQIIIYLMQIICWKDIVY
jgi:hypothetical protein